MKHLTLAWLLAMSFTMTLLPACAATQQQDSTAISLDTAAVNRAIAQSVTATMTSQIIYVENHTLSLWEKDNHDQWNLTLATYCGHGKNGLSLNRKEGDKTTPIGAFPLIQAFGIAPDPGSIMPYRQVTNNDYWSGEPQDYNTWVEVKPGTRRMPNSEHLIKYTVPYQYVFAIGFNIDPVVVGKGSAIFLHCKSKDSWSTAGCVSVPQDVMITLLRTCRPGTRIIIVPRLSYIDMLGL